MFSATELGIRLGVDVLFLDIMYFYDYCLTSLRIEVREHSYFRIYFNRY